MKKGLLILFLLFSLPCLALAVEASWVEEYERAASQTKAGEMASAAESFYRAQLASAWASKLRPSAFRGNGNDSGTARSALNEVVGRPVNIWAFKNPRARILPILNKLDREVAAIKTNDDLSRGIYSGASGSSNAGNKYPAVIDRSKRVIEFKSFAKNWLAQGRRAVAR